MQDSAFKHPTYGFRKLFAFIRRSCKEWNYKRIYRVYKLFKLSRRRKGKRRLPSRVKQPMVKKELINQSSSMDFKSESIVGGRRFRIFNLIDDCTREVLAIETDTSLSSKRFIRTLERVILDGGKSNIIRTDNGPDFTSKDLELCARDNEIQIQFIQPRRPVQKVYIERLNIIFRDSILDAYLFFHLV